MSNTATIYRLEVLEAKINRLERRLWLEGKVVYKQKEIVELMGLEGDQRRLLDLMKKTGLLHSPIKLQPLTYPGAVVRKAVEAVNNGAIYKK
ncbi:MAG TPA: hypothetical protein VJ953_18385 [Saprospiraceae bacterium]|nr:hypothetical protein [Saprospiraceae bacterium]